jgi:hypothetical protein
MSPAQITQTIADLTQAMTTQRPAISSSSCTCTGCTNCGAR